MKEITIIIPIHDYNNEIKTLLNKALESVPNNLPIIMSCGDKIVDGIKNDFAKREKVIFVTNENTSFQNLVNVGVNEVTTPYFSILEFDDTYTSIWFDEVSNYIEFNPNVSVFMPLEDLFDFNNSKFLGYGNEAAWASSFSEEIGFIDNACLENFFDFYMTGAVFNTDDWKDVGGLKKSIDMAFWYEYLLRVTHFDKKVMVVPKVGYIHNLNRENSLINLYSKNPMVEQ